MVDVGLFSGQVPRLEGVRIGKRIPESFHDARHAVDAESQLWVAKPDGDNNVILLEALGSELGRLLGAAVPETAVYETANRRRYWLSRCIEASTGFDRSFADQIVEPASAAAILAVDALLSNNLRRDADLVCEAVEQGCGRRLWMIDLASADVLRVGGVPRALSPPAESAAPIDGFPYRMLRHHVGTAIDRFQSLADERIVGVVRESYACAEQPFESRLCDHLLRLRDHASITVERHISSKSMALS